jgi:ATP-dependent DNA helicase RecG
MSIMQRINFDTPLAHLFRLPPKRASGLRHLKIVTVRDLLYHFPHRYEKPAVIQTIAETKEHDLVTIEGKIISIEAKKTWKTKKPMAEAVVEEVVFHNPFNPPYQGEARQYSPPMAIGGARGVLRAIWFHQPYVARQLPPGTMVRLTGKVTKYKNKLTMINPMHERISFTTPPNPPFVRGGNQEGDKISPPLQGGARGGNRIPIYPETYGVSSLWIHAAIENIFSRLSAQAGSTSDAFNDPLPEDIRRRYHLPSLMRALEAIHFSQHEKEAEGARKRFAFEEIFFIQLSRVAMRNERNRQQAVAIAIDHDLSRQFNASLPFALTKAQERVVEEIFCDLSGARGGIPMSRLLQGDVGSGKTLVAAAAALQVAKNPAAAGQTAYMAPTEILARQHFAEFCKRLGPFGVRIGLLTSSEAITFPSKAYPNKPAHLSKQQLFKKVKEGLVDVVIGTHALIANRKTTPPRPPDGHRGGNQEGDNGEVNKNSVQFKNLAFVIVDEQHRFGINQRAMLLQQDTRYKIQDTNNIVSHYLSMTATPIPRTLALTIYGDLDLSLLDEMPPGRVPLVTRILAPVQRDEAYQAIAQEVAAGHQAFVICPRIEEDDESGPPHGEASMKAVQGEYKHLQEKVFPEHAVGMLHGKLTPKEKEQTMIAFREKKFPILVATTVVEVGIDIPHATIMLIEGAERFGLAQLHQLRGRIGRSTFPSTCFAIPARSSKFVKERLNAFAKLRDGFALAEQDLQLRGPGELTGVSQWGISDVGMEALRNIKMVEAARNEAQRILAEDPRLDRHPQLKKAPTAVGAHTHLE